MEIISKSIKFLTQKSLAKSIGNQKKNRPPNSTRAGADKTIQDYTRTYKTMQDHTKTIPGYINTRPYTTARKTISGHIGPYETISGHTRQHKTATVSAVHYLMLLNFIATSIVRGAGENVNT